MDKQPLKIAAIVGVIVIAIAGLLFGMKTVSQSEEYAPSPGGQNSVAHMGQGKGQQSSAPGMPGGPPSDRVPGSAR